MHLPEKRCCRACRGALQICRWHSCGCHERGRDKDPDYTTETYSNPTAQAAIARADRKKKTR